ncbi:hypothetical protein COOONC_12945, partial [Cooperia oncophora]
MVAVKQQLVINAKQGEVPYATALAIAFGGYNPSLSITFNEKDPIGMNIDGFVIKNDITIARVVAQSLGAYQMYRLNCFRKFEGIDEVLTLCEKVVDGFLVDEEVVSAVQLSESGTLFGGRITIGDVALWSLLEKNPSLQKKFSALFDAIVGDQRFFAAHAMVGKFVDAKVVKPGCEGE